MAYIFKEKLTVKECWLLGSYPEWKALRNNKLYERYAARKEAKCKANRILASYCAKKRNTLADISLAAIYSNKREDLYAKLYEELI